MQITDILKRAQAENLTEANVNCDEWSHDRRTSATLPMPHDALQVQFMWPSAESGIHPINNAACHLLNTAVHDAIRSHIDCTKRGRAGSARWIHALLTFWVMALHCGLAATVRAQFCGGTKNDVKLQWEETAAVTIVLVDEHLHDDSGGCQLPAAHRKEGDPVVVEV